MKEHLKQLLRQSNYHLTHSRHISNYEHLNKKKPNNKVAVIAAALAIPLGAYMFYQYNFNKKPVFPDGINNLLRQALISEHRSDLNKSQILFRQAYQEAKKNLEENVTVDHQQLPIQISFNTPKNSSDLDPIKLSGIGIRWASLLEHHGMIDQAIQVYHQVFNDLRALITSPSNTGHLHLQPFMKVRAIELAHKLATLLSAKLDSQTIIEPKTTSQRPSSSNNHNSMERKIEEFLSFTVEEILKLMSSLPPNTSSSYTKEEKDSSLLDKVKKRLLLSTQNINYLDNDNEKELDLPDWIGRLNQASCFESLGSFYAQRGKIDYALPLYLQTLNILLPIQEQDFKTNSESESKRMTRELEPLESNDDDDEERTCQASTVMNNIASLLIQQYEKQQQQHHHYINNNNSKSNDIDREYKDENLNLLKNSKLWLTKSCQLSSKVLNKKIKSYNNLNNITDCQESFRISTANLINLNQKLVDLGVSEIINDKILITNDQINNNNNNSK